MFLGCLAIQSHVQVKFELISNGLNKLKDVLRWSMRWTKAKAKWPSSLHKKKTVLIQLKPLGRNGDHVLSLASALCSNLLPLGSATCVLAHRGLAKPCIIKATLAHTSANLNTHLLHPSDTGQKSQLISQSSECNSAVFVVSVGLKMELSFPEPLNP